MYMSTNKQIQDLIPKDEFSFSRPHNKPITRNEVGKLQETDYSISEDNLAIRYADGELKNSLERLRGKYHTEITSMDADHIPHPRGEHFNVFNESITYNEFSKQEEANFLRDVVEELQVLQLPLVLAENYIMALLYDTKITPTAIPANFFYVIAYMNMQGVTSLNLTTQDKEILQIGFRKFFAISPRGAIPKQFQKHWYVFKTYVLDIGKNIHRRRNNNRLNLIAVKKKQKHKKYMEQESVIGRRRRQYENYADMYDRITKADSDYSPKQISQILRKRKQRLKIRRKA